MKKSQDGSLVLSASDLVKFVECRHLAWLEHAVIRGNVEAAERPDGADDAALVSRKGTEHEDEVVAELRLKLGSGSQTFRQIQFDHNYWKWRELHDETVAAMRDGVACIYQAVLYDGRWLGVIDLLRRVDDVPAPALGTSWSYEVTDIKLARSVKVTQLLQLCLYSEMLGAAQGVAPAAMHLLLGDRRPVAYRVGEFESVFRATRARFEQAIDGFAQENSEAPYPNPVPHCALCEWAPRCTQRRRDDDHLSLVADIRATQVRKLAEAGVDTLTALAELQADAEVGRLSQVTLDVLRSQANLQLRGRTDGQLHCDLLVPSAPGIGFAALPPASPGDVFFDLEGDPYLVGGGTGTGIGGLEYLWGAVTVDELRCDPRDIAEPAPPDVLTEADVDHGEYLQGAPADATATPRFTAWWAHDPHEEQLAFEAFIDWLLERRRRWPDLRVYHYAPYEITAIRRMTTRYGTREVEVDELLEAKVFVDLYRVVRQTLRTSQESYSIKQIEAFYRPARAGDVTTAGSSIVEYEAWLDDGDEHRLRSIAHYNRDDCVSTWQLREWLQGKKVESAGKHGAWPAHGDGDSDPEAEAAKKISAARAELNELSECLLDVVPVATAAGEVATAEVARLLAHLMLYYVREDKQFWWARFDRTERSSAELVDDDECVGGLRPTGEESWPIARSQAFAMSFPPQATRLRSGVTDALDAATEDGVGEIVELDAEAGRLVLKRGPAVQLRALPAAIMPGRPVDRGHHKLRLRDVGQAWLRRNTSPGQLRGLEDGAGVLTPVARDLLSRSLPRYRGHTIGEALIAPAGDGEQADALQARVLAGTIGLATSLDESYLLIQGPPGTGKTYTAAHVIASLLRQGSRVGVSGPSHEAICNLVRAVDAVVDAASESYRGAYKHPAGGSGLNSPHAANMAKYEAIVQLLDRDECDLVAGTSWLFARPEFAGRLTHLVIDEAGQISLADALAVAGAAGNMILVGDPQQLPNVVKGAHPDGVGVSVLEHLLGDDLAVAPERGVFLPVTRRMHPAVTDFVSHAVYGGELRAHPCTFGQEIEGWGAGLRYAPVDHEGCGSESLAEAQHIRQLYDELLGATYLDHHGQQRELTTRDILVVAPYNLQVACLRAALYEDARIGTVDKFQGQEAPVVIYSMTTSSRDDAPRNLEFLFSRNRCNVAISRAQCLAILVASPSLLQSRCRSIEELRLVNIICNFVERAALLSPGVQPPLTPA